MDWSRLPSFSGLAPMASIADYAYRKICREYGAGIVYSEMVSIKGICYNDKATSELCRVRDDERPFGLQLFGSEPEYFEKAAVIAERYGPDFIDINMGCPVQKVTSIGAGSKLMMNPELAGRIVEAARKSVSCPITAKIRLGWDDDHLNAETVAIALQNAGVSALAVHGRTKQQLYSGKADWNAIARVKKAVNIPVIANGDVVDGESCSRIYSETGCDFVLVGRGSYGRPWVFSQIDAYMRTGEVLPGPCINERIEVMLRHISYLISDKGERRGMKEARKLVGFYIKGMDNAAQLRNKASALERYEDLILLTSQINRKGESL